MLGNLKKHYVGSITQEERAARIYDRHAILTHGLRAKTNFSYSKGQIMALLKVEEEILYNDVHNIEEFTVDFNGCEQEGTYSIEKTPNVLQKDQSNRAARQISQKLATIKIEHLSKQSCKKCEDAPSFD